MAAATRGEVPAALELSGFSGHVGEWELTGSLARDGDSRELAGSVKMIHVGWCSQDGPEKRSADARVRMARLTSSIDMTLRIDGVDCAFRGSLTDAYSGLMHCPDRRPVPLIVWLR